MLQPILAKDNLGKRYQLRTSSSISPSRKLKTKRFVDISSATRFIARLQINPSHLKKLIYTAGDGRYLDNHSDLNHLHKQIAQLLLRDKIKIIELKLIDQEKFPASKRTLNKTGGERVKFTPASMVEDTEQKKAVQFKTKQDAETFVKALQADPQAFAEIEKSLELKPSPANNPFAPADSTSSIAQALVDGEVVAVVDKVSGPKVGASGSSGAAEEDSAEETPSHDEVGLGPVAESNQKPANDEEKEEEKKPECSLISIDGGCSHGRTFENGHLDVVPAELGDAIDLSAKIKENCGDHALWEVRGPIGVSNKKGAKYQFKANNWRCGETNPRLLHDVVPQKYEITASTCAGRENLTVWSYPSDKISLKISGWGEDNSWQNHIDLMEKVMCQHLKEFKFNTPSGAISFSGQWVEEPSTSEAFYRYQISGGFNPVFGLTARIPFGPTAFIPQWVKRYGDVYCFVEFSGGLSLNLNIERLRPNKVSGYAELKGGIEGKIGASLFLMDDKVLKVEAFGTTGITGKAWSDKERVLSPLLYGVVEWEGLKLVLSIQVGGGWVEFNREYVVVEGGPFQENPAQADLFAMFRKGSA